MKNQEQIFEFIEEALQDTLSDPRKNITKKSRIFEDLKINETQYQNFIRQIELEFDITIPGNTKIFLKTVDQFVFFVLNQLEEK